MNYDVKLDGRKCTKLLQERPSKNDSSTVVCETCSGVFNRHWFTSHKKNCRAMLLVQMHKNWRFCFPTLSLSLYWRPFSRWTWVGRCWSKGWWRWLWQLDDILGSQISWKWRLLKTQLLYVIYGMARCSVSVTYIWPQCQGEYIYWHRIHQKRHVVTIKCQ